jgi:hypothetical protein
MSEQKVTLTGYLGKVSEFWADGANEKTCARCGMYEGPGYCAMLHLPYVPYGDCLGLLERDCIKQPKEE